MRRLTVLVFFLLLGAGLAITQDTGGTSGAQVTTSGNKGNKNKNKIISETNTVGGTTTRKKPGGTTNTGKIVSGTGRKKTTPPAKSTSTASSPTKTE